MRIGVGYLLQETNTFSPVETRWEDFGLVEGADVVDRWAETQTEIGGFLEALEASGHEAIPMFAGWAMTAGRLSAATFERLLATVRRRLEDAKPLDGLLLALHGSMTAHGTDDCDGRIVDTGRRIVGERPLVVTLDLHANLTPKIVGGTDAVIGYQTYPHTDMYATGVAGAELLIRTLNVEIRPVNAFKKLPLIVGAENMQTTAGPMKQVFDRGYEARDRGEVLSVSAFGVQPWLDVEEMGCATLAVADGNREAAVSCAERMADCFWELRDDFAVPLLRPRQAVELAAGEPLGPVILAETSDAPTAGAPGDSAELLLPLEQFALDRSALIWIRDPKVVAPAVEVGVGGRLRAAIGGVFDKVNHRPCLLDGEVRSISDGRFRFTGNYNRGMLNDMGTTTVVGSNNTTIVVSESAANMISPDVYSSQGLDPRDYHIVVVKSANSFRSEYDFATRVILVDTPGISPVNLHGLPYERVPRPIYPLDPF